MAASRRHSTMAIFGLALCLCPVRAPAAGPVFTTLFSFKGADGELPFGPIAFDGRGVLYGATNYGGNQNLGTIFSLTPPGVAGGTWKETVIWNVDGENGAGPPFGGLLPGPGGVIYGTTPAGGVESGGAVFSLTPPLQPQGKWTQQYLAGYFGLASWGANPQAGVIMDSNGVVYGTALIGPGGSVGSSGEVFSITPPGCVGNACALNILHSFQEAGDGATPGSLILGSDGTIYGTTASGGAGGLGTVFELTPPSAPGGSWTETILYSFNGAPDGAYPQPGMIAGSGGVFYGTTNFGGADNLGTIFSLTPPAAPGGSWTEAVLYSFSRKTGRGAVPTGTLALSQTTGAIYGTTQYTSVNNTGYGTIFELTPPASSGSAWTHTVVHTFVHSNGGAYPLSGLVAGSGGTLYGSTESGGSHGVGTVFSLAP